MFVPEPDDLAASTPSDLAVIADLAPSARPCHLVPAGPVVETLQFPDRDSEWYSDGLLRRSGANKHVVQYGSVSLRFGGWNDPAMYAREYDVSTWPPVPVAAPTELSWTMHPPSHMMATGADALGAVWWTDTDGVGPTGIRYRTVAAGGWSLGPERFLHENGGLLAGPVVLSGGEHFALVSYPRQNPQQSMFVSVFSHDGTLVQRRELAEAPLYDLISMARTGSETLVAMAHTTCAVDLGCSTSSLELLRLKGGTATHVPLELEQVLALTTPISGAQMYEPALLSDQLEHHFLTWWEPGDQRSTLFALPITAGGTADGPVEVWLTTPKRVGFSSYSPSVGPLGAIYPLHLSTPSDAGWVTETHLLLRQLVQDAPVQDLLIGGGLHAGYRIGTVQLDNPRTLIVGSSTSPPMRTTGGPGTLARFVCSED